MKSAENGKVNVFFSLFCYLTFVFNSSLVEEDNDSFGFDALELDGKKEDII